MMMMMVMMMMMMMITTTTMTMTMMMMIVFNKAVAYLKYLLFTLIYRDRGNSRGLSKTLEWALSSSGEAILTTSCCPM